jgi:hypothetical protein
LKNPLCKFHIYLSHFFKPFDYILWSVAKSS